MNQLTLGVWTRRLLLGVLAAGTIFYVVVSWRWEMVCDSPIMHYVNFLMAHGMKPYSQITDNNLPGSYMSEWLATKVFGPGDLGWRLYEFFVLAVLTAAAAVVTKTTDWAAGAFAGAMFVLLHGAEGPWLAGERELLNTALLMVGYAAMFTAVRRRQAWLMAVMGLTVAFSASIKPTMAPLGVLLLGLTAYITQRKGLKPWPYVGWCLFGVVPALAVNVAFLSAHAAWGNFLWEQRVITPYYVALQQVPYRAMLWRILPGTTKLVAVLGAILVLKQWRSWDWERWALSLAVVVGLTSYLQQHKGFLHHRYVFLTFLLVLIGIELMKALRGPGWPRWVATALVVLIVARIVPHSLADMRDTAPRSELTDNLQSDLEKLGGTAGLQGQVQCLDLVYGCLNALYRERLVENTGFTGDLLVFDDKDGPAVEYHRAKWWKLQQEHPASVLVLTDEYFQYPDSFDRVKNWPAYARYIAENYTEVVARRFPGEFGERARAANERMPHAYRIYVRNGTPEMVLAREKF